MGLEAATKALLDAGNFTPSYCIIQCGALKPLPSGITYDAIETAAVGYCYGDSTSGQVSGFVLVKGIY